MEAEDLLQDSFIKVFNSISDFQGRSTIGAWIKSICVNTCLKHLRKSGDLKFTNEESIPEPKEEESFEYDVALIHNAIKTLPKGARMIVNLFLIEGYAHSEIAQILNISESTSKSQYARGKKLLAQNLKGLIYE